MEARGREASASAAGSTCPVFPLAELSRAIPPTLRLAAGGDSSPLEETVLVSPLAYGNLEDHAESCNRFVRPGVCFFPPLLYAKVRKYMVATQYVSTMKDW